MPASMFPVCLPVTLSDTKLGKDGLGLQLWPLRASPPGEHHASLGRRHASHALSLGHHTERAKCMYSGPISDQINIFYGFIKEILK